MQMPTGVVMRRTAELVPYANNARTHTPEQVKQIAASIREFGFTKLVLISSTTNAGGNIELFGTRSGPPRRGKTRSFLDGSRVTALGSATRTKASPVPHRSRRLRNHVTPKRAKLPVTSSLVGSRLHVCGEPMPGRPCASRQIDYCRRADWRAGRRRGLSARRPDGRRPPRRRRRLSGRQKEKTPAGEAGVFNE